MHFLKNNALWQEYTQTTPIGQNIGMSRTLCNLNKFSHQTSGNTVVDGLSLLNVGDSYYSNPVHTITSGGIDKVDKFSSLPRHDMLDYVKQLLNGEAKAGNSMLGETWSHSLSKTLFEYESALSIDRAIKVGEFNMDGYSAIGDTTVLQFKAVAQYMKSGHLRKVNCEVYFVQQRGYDLHGGRQPLPDLFTEANNALAGFITELKRQGTWDDTVILMASDFGCSIAPNSNRGSDHTWGGKSRYFWSFWFSLALLSHT